MKQKSKTLYGNFLMPGGRSAVGELRLKGSQTLLKLHSDQELYFLDVASCLTGVTQTGDHITLIDCHSSSVGRSGASGMSARYNAEVFPHYTVIGRSYVDPSQACVQEIEFTTTDVNALFYDFDAFSQVADARPIIDAVLQERRQMRPVEAGDFPLVSYFTGKSDISTVSTAIGKVSVRHQPSFNLGGPAGVFIKNRIVVSITPEVPARFDDVVDRMCDLVCFLSVAAGRAQGIDNIRITTDGGSEDGPEVLAVHPSFRWRVSDKGEQSRPRPRDVPLDPVRHGGEYAAVLSHWISRQCEWRVARVRYLECLRKANTYGPERIVAAANMFDILPSDAVPSAIELGDELAATREACVAMFRQLPDGVDRNSALSALGRLGRPSLPKKVAYRVSIVQTAFAGRFADLQFVASVAVKCRNFFVHGGSGDFDYSKVEHLLAFLTNALEFVFAASDLIEAGWDVGRWNSEGHGWGHSFARFRDEYDNAAAELRRVAV